MRSASSARTMMPSFLAELVALGAHAFGGFEIALGLLVGDQLDRADQAHAVGLAHQRMIAQRLEPFEEMRRHMAHMAEDVAALDRSRGS